MGLRTVTGMLPNMLGHDRTRLEDAVSMCRLRASIVRPPRALARVCVGLLQLPGLCHSPRHIQQIMRRPQPRPSSQIADLPLLAGCERRSTGTISAVLRTRRLFCLTALPFRTLRTFRSGSFSSSCPQVVAPSTTSPLLSVGNRATMSHSPMTGQCCQALRP